MSAATKSERALPWALVTPALGWTLLFFVLPFVAMAVSSLTAHEA
ncbi:MAG: ABC transporter permease, partial [Mesorhizobium sp.]